MVRTLSLSFIGLLVLVSCQTTVIRNGCACLLEPTTGKIETTDAKIDKLSRGVSGILPRTFVPRKAGRMYFSFSRQNDSYSMNLNTYFSALIDDMERIKPENKLNIVLNDSTKMELTPADERLATDSPEAVYLCDSASVASLANAKSIKFFLSYTGFDKKTKIVTVPLNKDYLGPFQDRARCILAQNK